MDKVKGGYGGPSDSDVGDGTGLKGGVSPTSMEKAIPTKPNTGGNDGGGMSGGGGYSGTKSSIPEGAR